MGMPRPGGEARKIAVKVIPGLHKNFVKKASYRKKYFNDEDVESMIIKENEDMDVIKTFNKKKEKGSMY